MKTPHRTSVPNLQNAALGTARTLKRIEQRLGAEIAANTQLIEPGENTSKYVDQKKLPETVTYPTKDIDQIIWDLVRCRLELQWWATPVEQRSKLDKPFSLR